METKLDKQIVEKREELALFEKTAARHLERYMSMKVSIHKCLSGYKPVRIDDSNIYIDVAPISGKLILRVRISTGAVLTDRQVKNLERRLRSMGVPMPICPISTNGEVHICIHDKD